MSTDTSSLAPQRPAHRSPGRTADRWRAAAVLSVGIAGLLHALTAVGHGDHGVVVVGFFAVTAVGQVLLACWLRRPCSPLLAAAGLATTVALIILYVASRIAYLPFVGGSHNDRPEDPETLGTIVIAFELISVVALARLLTGRWRAWALNGVLVAGAWMWVLWLTGALS